jgi:hypothetical protein
MSSGNDQGPPAANDTGGQNPPPTPPLPETRETTIINWLRRVYVDHSHLANPLAPTIKNFISIVATRQRDGSHYWLGDAELVLALVLLTNSRKRQNDMLIVPPNAASELARVGKRLSGKNDFMTGEFSRECYDAMRKDSIRWVVVPVTDGMGADTIPGGGMHWGLMIIDKQRNDARWLDGNLALKRKHNKKWCIESMLPAGTVAGQILCGYDTVMDLEKGHFTAATLKHVPHDTNDNKYKRDGGSACGPWVFAILKYILERPSLLSNENGLHGAFRLRKKREHQMRMAFDSLETRKCIQETIRGVADANLDEDELPFRMTVRMLKILHSPSTAELLQWFSSLERHSRSSGKGGLSKGPDDDDDDGEDDDRDPDKDPDDEDSDLQAALEKSYNVNNNTAAQGSSSAQDTGFLNTPDGLTMPKDFADSNEVNKLALEQWKKTNDMRLEQYIPWDKKKHANDTSYRAALYVSKGHSFDKESEDRLRNVWANDSYAINQLVKDTFSPQAIRQAMINAYKPTKRIRTDSGSEGRATKTSEMERQAAARTRNIDALCQTPHHDRC